MSLLVAYASSDEDEELDGWNREKQGLEVTQHVEQPAVGVKGSNSSTNGLSAGFFLDSKDGPSSTSPLAAPVGSPQPVLPDRNPSPALLSPYMAQRTKVRDLTLLTNLTLDIPPSPQSSPTDADHKFASFLGLKQQNVHFNAKLASSTALKNPSLLPKMMRSAGLKESEQYVTTLPLDLWNPLCFPDWAYKEELGENQQEMSMKREDVRMSVQRESIDFVSAPSSKGEATGSGLRGLKESAAERVMAGLARERKS